MPTDTKDLKASVDVYELKVVLGVPSINAAGGYKEVSIPYTGIGDPSDSSVSITRAWYSLDGGATWSVMTPTDNNVSTGLTFSSSGTSLEYKWKAREDLGTSLYNTLIKVAFIATSIKGDSLQATRNVLFGRTVTDQTTTTSQAVSLPEDYAGVFGNELLVNAPKSGR